MRLLIILTALFIVLVLATPAKSQCPNAAKAAPPSRALLILPPTTTYTVREAAPPTIIEYRVMPTYRTIPVETAPVYYALPSSAGIFLPARTKSYTTPVRDFFFGR